MPSDMEAQLAKVREKYIPTEGNGKEGGTENGR